MSIIAALVTGALIGWGSSIRGGTDGRDELFMNVAIGSVGAYLGGWALSAVSGGAHSTHFSVGVLVAAILGATTSLVVVNNIRNA